MCEDGRPQMWYTPKEDVSLPTIYLESQFTSIIIDGHYGRNSDILNDLGAYLNANILGEKFTILKIEGEFVDIMCKVNP